MRTIAVLLLCLSSMYASAQIAMLKVEHKTENGKLYRLYIRHKKTPVTIEGGEDPALNVHRTKCGLIYGTIDVTEDGEILVSKDIAFAQYRGNLDVKNEDTRTRQALPRTEASLVGITRMRMAHRLMAPGG